MPCFTPLCVRNVQPAAPLHARMSIVESDPESVIRETRGGCAANITVTSHRQDLRNTGHIYSAWALLIHPIRHRAHGRIPAVVYFMPTFESSRRFLPPIRLPGLQLPRQTLPPPPPLAASSGQPGSAPSLF